MQPSRDLRTAFGFLLLAALAWTVPPLLSRLGRSPPPPKVVYGVGDGQDLLWSPRGGLLSAEAEGTVLDGRGKRLGPLGGWRGLLLGNPLELNEASGEDLEALPGVGPKTAASILEERQDRGRFSSVDELLDVKGIGPKTVERLRPWLRTRPTETSRHRNP